MKNSGFTLIELLITLIILSLVLSIALPQILKRSLNSEKAIENKIKSLFSNSFSLSNPVEICIDFRNNSLSVGKEKIKLPFRAENVVLPGRVISSEQFNKFCFKAKYLNYGAILGENKNEFLSIFFVLPTGEVKIYKLNSSEEETFKDKIEKGRIVEWFSYYLQ